MNNADIMLGLIQQQYSSLHNMFMKRYGDIEVFTPFIGFAIIGSIVASMAHIFDLVGSDSLAIIIGLGAISCLWFLRQYLLCRSLLNKIMTIKSKLDTAGLVIWITGRCVFGDYYVLNILPEKQLPFHDHPMT